MTLAVAGVLGAPHRRCSLPTSMSAALCSGDPCSGCLTSCRRMTAEVPAGRVTPDAARCERLRCRIRGSMYSVAGVVQGDRRVRTLHTRPRPPSSHRVSGTRLPPPPTVDMDSRVSVDLCDRSLTAPERFGVARSDGHRGVRTLQYCHLSSGLTMSAPHHPQVMLMASEELRLPAMFSRCDGARSPISRGRLSQHGLRPTPRRRWPVKQDRCRRCLTPSSCREAPRYRTHLHKSRCDVCHTISAPQNRPPSIWTDRGNVCVRRVCACVSRARVRVTCPRERACA